MGWAIGLTLWAIAVLVVSALSARGRLTSNSINGMRRRNPSESDEAWAAGLAAYHGWTIASAITLLVFAALIVITTPGFDIALVVAAVLLVLLQVGPLGISALNAAIRLAQRAEHQNRWNG